MIDCSKCWWCHIHAGEAFCMFFGLPDCPRHEVHEFIQPKADKISEAKTTNRKKHRELKLDQIPPYVPELDENGIYKDIHNKLFHYLIQTGTYDYSIARMFKIKRKKIDEYVSKVYDF